MSWREAVPATPRARMTPTRRARVLAKHDDCCAFPGCASRLGLEIDHTIALKLGGKDDDSNLAPLCRDHHKKKTRLDAKLIAKMRRRQKAGEVRVGVKIRARPFPKGPKRAWPTRSFG